MVGLRKSDDDLKKREKVRVFIDRFKGKIVNSLLKETFLLKMICMPLD